MKIQTVNVTPEIAKKWLKGNKQNRPMRKAYVRSLAESMQRGEWTLTHQPIALINGRLLDGQHRLEAMIQSGLDKVPMTVAFDVPAETFDVIDIGARRSHSDIFSEDPVVMHPISLIGRIVYGAVPTPREMVPIHAKLNKKVRELVACHTTKSNRLTAAGIKVGALAAILNGEDKDYVHDLYRKMCAFDLDGIPRVAQLFMKQVTLDRGKKLKGSERHQLVVRSFIAFQKANAGFDRLMIKDIGSRMDKIRDIYRNALGMK